MIMAGGGEYKAEGTLLDEWQGLRAVLGQLVTGAEPTALLQQEAHPEQGLGFKSPFYSTPVHRVQERSTPTRKACSTMLLHQ